MRTLDFASSRSITRTKQVVVETFIPMDFLAHFS